MLAVKPGTRLYSTMSSVELIVVKGAEGAIDCAGVPMADARHEVPAPAAEGDAIFIGKRYADETSGLLVLITKGGIGPITMDGRPLQIEAARPLPASD